jgi:peptide-methionine (R)-S-oxide reductase
MKATKIYFLALMALHVSIVSCQQKNAENLSKSNKQDVTNSTTMQTNFKQKTEEEWKKILTEEQYAILRGKGTERPWTGKYNEHFEKGKYVCAGCGFELFTSESKFNSHCGWPSFDAEIEKGNVATQTDYTHGMVRTEILCSRCGGHLGHVFDDGPTKTGLRYCVNSVSIDFKKDSTESNK